MRPKPVVLAILDGWGIAPKGEGNAVTLAKTPNMDKFIATCSVMTIRASGGEVGLSWGEMGTSEVGHLNLGTGRIFYQTLPRINKSIDDGSFFENSTLKEAAKHVQKNRSSLHMMGLVSAGKVHTTIEHLFALLKFAREENLKKVYIHAFLDGRDTVYNSGIDFIKKLQAKIKEYGVGQIATLSGRFYAMDRDNRWDRVEKAYKAIALGESDQYFSDPIAAIRASYDKKVYDEEFIPTVIGKHKKPTATIQEKDAIIFFNYRADRARQLTRTFVLKDFDKFERSFFPNLFFATMTEYEKGLPVKIVFPPEEIKTCLAKVLAEAGLKQLHIAETEKYAHVTFFFNGMREEEFKGEDRIIIPSPRVASYDQKPEMSAPQITDKLVKEIVAQKYDFIVVNFANADMVGHTGNLEATIKAVQTVDECLGEITNVILSLGGVLLITADHGNAEEIVNLQTNEMDKEHSTNPVPFILVARGLQEGGLGSAPVPEGDLSLIPPVGVLADVAPTILKIMDISKPEEMTGAALI